MPGNKFRINNFDLIRLLAALQVVLVHAVEHLDISIKHHFIYELLKLFPGVPIFFFISGFLISKSYESSSTLYKYYKKRILRIYPALITCFLLANLTVLSLGYYENRGFSSELLVWTVCQLSFLQFYNTDFFDAFGIGVLNGSLWTISVELQFYLLTPVIYASIIKPGRLSINTRLIALLALFLIVNQSYIYIKHLSPDNMYIKIFGFSFFPWFYMFVLGILFQRNFEFLHKYLYKSLPILLPMYLVAAHLSSLHFEKHVGNYIFPINFFILASTCFCLAYSIPNLSSKILNHNDISYGVYIYHMPVINVVIYTSVEHHNLSMLYILASTLALATLSWRFVEKPFLKLKRDFSGAKLSESKVENQQHSSMKSN